jgi:large subunit ribosomal protein LP2
MKYLSAYALAWLSGNTNPSVKDLEKIISAIGGTFDKKEAETVVDSLTERDIVQVIRAGLPRIQAGGSGAVSASAAPAAAAATSAADTKKEDKKDEKKDEEADFDGGLDMFGGDDF